MRHVFTAACACLLSMAACAREADGSLGLVLLPNDARPALVQSGGTFSVLTRAEAELRLTSVSATHSLSTAWARLPSGLYEGVSHVPAEIAAGTYTLEADSDGGEDRNSRSVFVYDVFPVSYRIAHLTNLRIGAETGRDTRIYQSTKAINEAGVSIVLVTGDLTSAGSREQFAQALDLLSDCRAPTLVSLGSAEIASALSRDYLGPATFTHRFGLDGYLGYYTSELGELDLRGRSGKLHRARRSIRDARWSVGFTNHYGPESCLRDQLVLFRDNPLDYVICAKRPGGDQAQFSVPWGRTSGFAMQATARGAVQIFDVGLGGLQLVQGPGSE
ncbi:MAG: hypothetical protein QGD90_05920 [Candidatus Hydrogenedentes bacterium]|nr:hypothetical protein [Candidatus Hydrogenedentota bacterium]